MLGLNVDHSVISDKTVQIRSNAFDPSEFVRRIKKHNIERRPTSAIRGGEFYRIRAHHLQAAIRIQQTSIGVKCGEDFRGILDHDHARSAT